MKEELGTPGAIVGMVILACLFGGLTFAIYPGWQVVGAHLPNLATTANWSDFVAVVSAIGTCAAVLVALHLAGKQAREDKARRLEIAQLHAAGITASLKHAHDHMGMASFLLLLGHDSESKSKAVLQAISMLSSNLKRPTLEQLTMLTPLPNHCSHRIARAFDLFDVVHELATSFRAADYALHPPEKTQEILHGLWGPSLRQSIDHLQVAMAECEHAANVGAPPPTALELYGEWSDDEYP